MSESKINEQEAVTQESLEPKNEGPSFSAKFDDFSDEQPPQHEQQVSNETTDNQVEVTADPVDEGGMEPVVETAESPQEQKEVQPKGEEQVEIEDLELPSTEATEEVVQPKIDPQDMPEWVSKLVDFHKETGGGMEEYLNYTRDFDSLNDTQVLKEYYKATKPGYTNEDIDLLLEHKFGTESYGEGEEMSREDRLKQLALKDEVQSAKQFLNSNKDKYYADLKSGVLGAPEQYKEAVKFYDDYKKSSEVQKASRENFVNQSKQLFNEEFRGFQFDAGGKKYNLKVGNAETVMNGQMNINEILGSFFDESGNITDVKEYHRSVWAAQNADKLFNAGIEAGKAQILKERAQATKNPSYANEGQSQTPSTGQKVKFLDTDF